MVECGKLDGSGTIDRKMKSHEDKIKGTSFCSFYFDYKFQSRN